MSYAVTPLPQLMELRKPDWSYTRHEGAVMAIVVGPDPDDFSQPATWYLTTEGELVPCDTTRLVTMIDHDTDEYVEWDQCFITDGSANRICRERSGERSDA